MMMKGSAPGRYIGPGYDASRGSCHGYGALRGTRELYRHVHRAGPSPFVPATILGVILFITVMPYMHSPDLATLGCYHQAALRASTPLLWIPVASVIALQFFGASDWCHGVYFVNHHGARPGVGHQGRAYCGAAMSYAMERGGWWSWSGPSSWNQNTHLHRGMLSTFMDYGSYWLLILLGVAVFTLVSSSSLPPVPLAPSTLGFPWSWLF